MKRILFHVLSLSLFSIMTPALAAETYTLDPNHTSVVWHASHFGFSNPMGRFGIQEGSVILDETSPSNSSVKVVIDVGNLATGIPKFDEHLKSADFLDFAKFPSATFVSTKVETTGEAAAKVTGDLTLHGVTRPVTLDLKLNKLGTSPVSQKKTAGFSGHTVIKRSDFGIDKYVPNVSDEIRIDIEAEANVAEK